MGFWSRGPREQETVDFDAAAHQLFAQLNLNPEDIDKRSNYNPLDAVRTSHPPPHPMIITVHQTFRMLGREHAPQHQNSHIPAMQVVLCETRGLEGKGGWERGRMQSLILAEYGTVY
jgi:hypothetical protein